LLPLNNLHHSSSIAGDISAAGFEGCSRSGLWFQSPL
jgi:hypothetical protein